MNDKKSLITDDDPKVKKALEIAIKKKSVSAKNLQGSMHIDEFEALWLIYTMYFRGWVQIEPTTELKTSVSSIEHAERVWHERSEEDNESNHETLLDDTRKKLEATNKQGKIVVVVLILIIIFLLFKPN